MPCPQHGYLEETLRPPGVDEVLPVDEHVGAGRGDDIRDGVGLLRLAVDAKRESHALQDELRGVEVGDGVDWGVTVVDHELSEDADEVDVVVRLHRELVKHGVHVHHPSSKRHGPVNVEEAQVLGVDDLANHVNLGADFGDGLVDEQGVCVYQVALCFQLLAVNQPYGVGQDDHLAQPKQPRPHQVLRLQRGALDAVDARKVAELGPELGRWELRVEDDDGRKEILGDVLGAEGSNEVVQIVLQAADEHVPCHGLDAVHDTALYRQRVAHHMVDALQPGHELGSVDDGGVQRTAGLFRHVVVIHLLQTERAHRISILHVLGDQEDDGAGVGRDPVTGRVEDDPAVPQCVCDLDSKQRRSRHAVELGADLVEGHASEGRAQSRAVDLLPAPRQVLRHPRFALVVVLPGGDHEVADEG
eukprot:174512-Hanusia_phi.AAC.2